MCVGAMISDICPLSSLPTLPRNFDVRHYVIFDADVSFHCGYFGFPKHNEEEKKSKSIHSDWLDE